MDLLSSPDGTPQAAIPPLFPYALPSPMRNFSTEIFEVYCPPQSRLSQKGYFDDEMIEAFTPKCYTDFLGTTLTCLFQPLLQRKSLLKTAQTSPSSAAYNQRTPHWPNPYSINTRTSLYSSAKSPAHPHYPPHDHILPRHDQTCPSPP